MRHIQSGFTLLELMITVAIVGILASIALPAYSGYSVRTQVSEGLLISGQAKKLTAQFYFDRGTWPTNMAALGLAGAVTSNYVSGVTMASGTITITYGLQASASILGETLSLKPLVGGKPKRRMGLRPRSCPGQRR